VTDERLPIRIGIGIGSGQVIAGYTGTMRRATYTCVGDAVKVAARLEAQTKLLGEPTLMDEATRRGLDGSIAVVEKGELEIKGKRSPVRVYALANVG